MKLEQQYAWFRRSFGIMGILLFWTTWKLWTPQTEYPQIPFFELLIDVPANIDWIAFIYAGVSLVVIALVSPEAEKSQTIQKVCFLGFAAAAIVLILLNQHRLQPWAYQLTIFAILAALAKPKTAFFWMRWIVISIYLYSALSKFDYQFVHTVGVEMLTDFGLKFGLNLSFWSPEFVQNLVYIMPRTELSIGLGLIFPKTRKLASIAAIGLHLFLLFALFGSVDGWGVLIWNLFFIDMIFLLFLVKLDKNSKEDDVQPRYPMEHLASAIAIFVLAFPLTNWIGICDHWPAWQVYAPRTSRAEFTLEVGKFDTYFDPSVEKTDSGQLLGVPVYPQARFQLGVLIAILEKHEWDYSIKFSGTSDPFTGERDSETLTARDQMKMKASQFFLNTKPRSFYFDSADEN